MGSGLISEARLKFPSSLDRAASEGRAAATARRPIVSMTSYPARVGSLHVTVQSLLRQTCPPEQVVLTLASSQFPRKELPGPLTRLRPRGLTVRWVDRDLGSYKKLLPILREYQTETIVTADDDTLYPPYWLEGLSRAQVGRRDSILGWRGARILVDVDGIRAYEEWPVAQTSTGPVSTFLTGMGGIQYPAGSLPEAVTTDAELAMRLCPYADDIWFKVMALLKGTETRAIVDRFPAFAPNIRAGQRQALHKMNVGRNRNGQLLELALRHFGLYDATVARLREEAG